jgi:hypothetical protein
VSSLVGVPIAALLGSDGHKARTGR